MFTKTKNISLDSRFVDLENAGNSLNCYRCIGSFHVKSNPYAHQFEQNFYTVSVELLIHSEFQHSVMSNFTVRGKQKIDFSEKFSLPVVTKSSMRLTLTYNLHHLLLIKFPIV